MSTALFSQYPRCTGGKADMLDTPALVIGFTGAAFLIGSLAPVALESRERAAAAAPAAVVKGDRLPVLPGGSRRSTVSTIEVLGASDVTIVFKDRDGLVLFRSDPLANSTLVAKDVDLPVITLKEEPAASTAPVVQQPQPTREGSEPPPTQPRRPKQIGCEPPVSGLARSDASRVPGLCLAALAPSARS
jgi:hypothetical protein